MLSFVSGTVAEKVQESPRGSYFVVDSHGMGFEIRTSERSIQSSPLVGESIRLYTSLIVREDSMTLVGFISREERDLFNILQSASGVGSKVALSLLSTLSVSELAQAVVSGQHKPLTTAKGVGPKLAQKIVLDLKEKMTQWRSSDISAAAAFQPTLSANDLQPEEAEAFQEAESVLLALGYHMDEIRHGFHALRQDPALADATKKTPSSEIILRDTLRWLAQSV